MLMILAVIAASAVRRAEGTPGRRWQQAARIPIWWFS
jgi:hypothetical protein